MILPRNQDGRPYISYSQVKGWNETKSFHLKKPGKYEYMLEYFFGHDFGDPQGWADFGNRAEDYICFRKEADTFDDREKGVLESIKPLGIYQEKITINFGDFDLIGYIDDATMDFYHLRDYKTASEKSKKKYYEDDYVQLDIYAMWAMQERKVKMGDLNLEVCIIERKGNPFRGETLTVGEQVWYHNRTTSRARQKAIKENILQTAKEISQHFQVYQKLCQV